MVQKKFTHQMDSQVVNGESVSENLVDPDSNGNCNNSTDAINGNKGEKKENVEENTSNEPKIEKVSVNGGLSNGDSDQSKEDESEERDERYEMIIRESVPEELPPDVVRCNSRVNDGLDDLQINLGSLRQRFESICDSSPSSPSPINNRSPDKAIQRSESILIRLKRYQSAISGSRKMSGNDEDEVNSEDELSENEGESSTQDPSVTRESKGREKVIPFAGLSSLKSQWESGTVNGTESTNDGEEGKSEVVDGDVKEELYKLRQRICLGRSASMRQMYEKGGPTLSVATQSNGCTHRQETALVANSVKAGSIKDKFEKGQIENQEVDRLESLKKEKMADLKVVAIAETAAREAKQIFKKMDASIKHNQYNKRDSLPPTSSPRRSFVGGGGLARSFTTSAIRPNKDPDLTNVVRYCDPVEKDDVMIDTTQLQERYKFFEQYKEAPKEPKRFEMTPPRDVAPIVKESEPVQNGNPDIVKCSYVTDDIPKTDTAKKMLGKFKQLESQASQEVVVSNGPKPMKRITPPREFQPINNNNNNNNPEENGKVDEELKLDQGQRDPNIVRSEDKVEEVIPVEPEMARSLKAKFENWATEVSKLNEKNREKDQVDEGDSIPAPDITKNLKAKFEAIKDESISPSVVEKPKPRVTRFVRTSSTSS